MGKEIAVESFSIQQANGLPLKGEVRTQIDGSGKPVLIVSHGFRGHRNWGFWPDVASRFAELGYYTVNFDFTRIAARHLQVEEKKLAEASTITQELHDLNAVLSNVLEAKLPLAGEADRSRVSLLGHSRSGGSSIILASEQPDVRAVIVWNGGSGPVRSNGANGSSQTLIEKAVNEDVSLNTERFDIVKHFKELRIPALVVQGDADNERLLQRNKELKAAAPHQKFIDIAGGDHTFGVADPYQGSSSQLDQAVEETHRFLQLAVTVKAPTS
ncbi:alpha/beta hydrolase family protein [Paenibacillus naphthalenovorans]|uniref:alpha/beta hydrolase family protein n=1 Tax=Paenibacillus naphthalenovorans TaxID=162209 RepID=UPI003D2B9BA3